MINFFQEHNGDFSMTRLLVFLIIVNALIVLDYQIIQSSLDKEKKVEWASIISLIGTASALKLVQKQQERKFEDNTTKENG